MFKKSCFMNFAVVIIASLCVMGCASTAPVIDTSPVQTSEYKLGAGDKLRLIVFGQTDLSGEFTVATNGKVSFPLILETQVTGLTTKELEHVIAQKLSPKYLVNPRVSVEVIAYRDVYILGEVRTPGKYSYIPDMTVQKAVAIAGGYTDRGQRKHAELTRQEEGVINTKNVGSTSILMPGDTLVIPRRWF